jgi:hypothetical protein
MMKTQKMKMKKMQVPNKYGLHDTLSTKNISAGLL